MLNPKTLITGENVDAVWVNGKYQDETQPLNLNSKDILNHQFVAEITTTDEKNIKLCFYSLQDLLDFSKAYELK